MEKIFEITFKVKASIEEEDKKKEAFDWIDHFRKMQQAVLADPKLQEQFFLYACYDCIFNTDIQENGREMIAEKMDFKGEKQLLFSAAQAAGQESVAFVEKVYSQEHDTKLGKELKDKLLNFFMDLFGNPTLENASLKLLEQRF